MTADSGEDFSHREFPMTSRDYERIQKIAYELTGISLSEHKKNMIYGRLARRLRKLQTDRFSSYIDLINQRGSPEQDEFVNAITTNLTSFFREGHHFDYLKNTIIPKLMKQNLSTKRIRVWSAGCSTGEEPYSIAMVFKNFAALSNWDIRILATDLDTNVLDTGKNAIYSMDRADSVPELYRKNLEVNADQESVRIKDNVSSIIRFNQLNLMLDWPIKGPFDVIFCRNVVIYFDIQTQKKLFDRYANLMSPNGHLFIGHSENLHNITDRFQSVGRTIYQRSK